MPIVVRDVVCVQEDDTGLYLHQDPSKLENGSLVVGFLLRITQRCRDSYGHTWIQCEVFLSRSARYYFWAWIRNEMQEGSDD